RDQLESLGPRLLRTVASVTAEVNSAALPKELAVIVNVLTATNYPTHMLVVYAPVPKKSENASPASLPKTKVKLYPVHALFMASHCARLGPFPPSPITVEVSTPLSTLSTITLPIRPMCLPSPRPFLYYYTTSTSTARKSSSTPSSQPNLRPSLSTTATLTSMSSR
ncbi:hypothetical protein BT96DRAFT_1094230, partial [Gymnopus androsaceus JB14]